MGGGVGRAGAGVLVAFALVYVVWGPTYLAIRYAVATLPPFLMAGSRFLLAGSALYTWARLRGAAPPSGANWRATAIIGGLLLLGGNGSVVWAEQRGPSGLAALLGGTGPLWVGVMEGIRPRPPPRPPLGGGARRCA